MIATVNAQTNGTFLFISTPRFHLFGGKERNELLNLHIGLLSMIIQEYEELLYRHSIFETSHSLSTDI